MTGDPQNRYRFRMKSRGPQRPALRVAILGAGVMGDVMQAIDYLRDASVIEIRICSACDVGPEREVG